MLSEVKMRPLDQLVEAYVEPPHPRNPSCNILVELPEKHDGGICIWSLPPEPTSKRGQIVVQGVAKYWAQGPGVQ
jgi:hypothetical protein